MLDRRLCLIFAAGLAGAAQWPAAARAASVPRMVVELFTSQGCSSCPPADALLAELARDPEVIALSLPVDYWDYLGWKDTLASHAYTMRQKGYSIARGDREVYTPQAVINGLAHAIGSKRHQIEKLAAATRGTALTASLSLSRADGRWTLDLPATRLSAPARLFVMTVKKSCDVAIGRGENANRKMTYANVVRSIETLGEWDGTAKQIVIDPALIAVEDADGFVVLAQALREGKPSAIVGAVKSAGL